MELTDVIRQRRMVRSFATDAIDPVLVERLLEDALRGPSAGNTRGVAWVVLEGDDTATYWEHVTTPDWRSRSRRYRGLSRAPVIALSVCSPAAYADRYGEADKEGSGLRTSGAWPVPYWFGDAAFSTMLLLLGATATDLGAGFLGNFRGEETLLPALGVPTGWRLFGAVLLGRPDDEDHPSRSRGRPPAAGGGAVHRSGW